MKGKTGNYRWLVVIWLLLLMLSLDTACSSICLTAPLPTKTAGTQSSEPASPRQLEEKPLPAVSEGKVTQVLGDSVIESDLNGKPCLVRYIGIEVLMPYRKYDSPEYYAQEAYKKNYELVNGKTVRLEKDISETDSKGRLLRYVWVDNLLVNAELIMQGYAQVLGCPPDMKYYDLFVRLQIVAQHDGRGLWSLQAEQDGSVPVPGIFVGNIESKLFHYSTCEFAGMINERNKMSFSSAASALARGYKACKACKPPDKLCNQSK